jgi:dipeptidyl aminopeptidase/acylaminoacyl peptidase
MIAKQKRRLTKADYDHAFELWPTELSRKVQNSQIEPNWLRDGTDDFWYLHGEKAGFRFVIVNSANATSRPAFDHAHLATLLSQRLGRHIDAHKLPLANLRFETDRSRAKFFCDGRAFAFDLLSSSLEPADGGAALSGLISPDGKKECFRNGHNLWCRDRSTFREWPLTTDGEAHRAYGAMPDHDRMAVARSRGLVNLPPIGVFWSPDSRQILALRCDERNVKEYVFLESSPINGSFRPKSHAVKIPFAGDRDQQNLEYVLIAADGSGRTELTHAKDWRTLKLELAENGVLHWTGDGQSIYALAATPDRKRAALACIDRSSGACGVMFEEQSDTFFDFNAFDYNRPNVEFLTDDKHAIWYSQRSGWGHLYLIDLEHGRVKRQITEGEFPIFDIIRLDGAQNTIYYLAGGLDSAENPYHRHLLRSAIFASRANADFKQLTQPGYDHAIAARPLHLMGLLTGTLARDSLSPSATYFVDNRSTVEEPTVTTIVRTTGEIVGEFCKASVDELAGAGWRPPQPFTVDAGDGKSRIWGQVIRPRDRSANEVLPVIERIYAGPQMIAQPRSFHETITGAFIYGAYTLAEFGFAVILMDTPGTPYRSKAWHDAPYGAVDRLNVCQHAAVLKVLLSADGSLSDTDIGINGHSWGGHASVMGMLIAPETYKVGVSSAGIYDPAAFFTDASEKVLGAPVYKDGSRFRGSDDEEPENYSRMSPSSYVQNLTGRLLLAYGELDENAPPAGAVRLAASLIRKKKTFDMLCLPGANHSLFAEPYFQTRLINYFLCHLRNDEPLEHYVPDVAAGSRMLI